MYSRKIILKIRRIVQILVFSLFIYVIWTAKHSLNNSALINPSIFFHIDPFVIIITSIAERVLLFGLIISLIILIITFVFGRVFCGWICPLGAAFDFIAYIKKYFVKSRYREKEPNKAINFKYAILGGVFILAIFGIQIAWFFDPISIFVRTLSFNIHPFINNSIDKLFAFILKITNYYSPFESFYYSIKSSFLDISNPVFPHTILIFIIFVVLIAAVFFKRRFWCRYICPLGAMLALISRFSFFKRRVHLCKEPSVVSRQYLDICRADFDSDSRSEERSVSSAIREQRATQKQGKSGSAQGEGSSLATFRQTLPRHTSEGMPSSAFVKNWLKSEPSNVKVLAGHNTNCIQCKNLCRMNAIKSDNSYLPQECILCLDCITFCPGKSTFSFKDIIIKKQDNTTHGFINAIAKPVSLPDLIGQSIRYFFWIIRSTDWVIIRFFELFKPVIPECLNLESRFSVRNGFRLKTCRNDNTYENLIMPQSASRMMTQSKMEFKCRNIPTSPEVSKGKMSRGQFLVFLSSMFAFRRRYRFRRNLQGNILRPPGALPEKEFLDRCIRCGNCMKVCPTNTLQPVILESGLSGIWTPKIDTNIGYCEYLCTQCGQVCPTGAIKKLTQEEKKSTKIGTASVNRKLCLSWAKDTECLVCEEHCPISSKAIKVIKKRTRSGKIIGVPVVDKTLCVGCGICEYNCPSIPKTITVRTEGEMSNVEG